MSRPRIGRGTGSEHRRTHDGRATFVRLRLRAGMAHACRMRYLPTVVRARAAFLVCLTALVLTAPPASAAASIDPVSDTFTTAPKVTRRGSCSGPSVWRLRLVKDDGRIKVRFEVSGGKAAQRWNIFISDSGDRIFAGDRISGPNGSFVVRTATRDRDGRTRIRAGANNTVSGETCRGRAAI